MRRILALLALALAALAAAGPAGAHPLGNFTINRFSGVELSGDRIYVHYVLDMAEIPTFQERQRITSLAAYERATTARIGRGLLLSVGGRRLSLTAIGHSLAFPPGQGGLDTLRFQALYETPALPGGQLDFSFRDTNYADRIGWKEVVVASDSGARVLSSTAPATSRSDELRAYPKNLLQSPLDVTGARAVVVAGSGAGRPPALLTLEELRARAAVAADGGFARLIVRDHLDVGVVLLSLLVALFWGAAHAFSPGHGKTIVAAYLVGSRGTPRQALLLGAVVTVTHTIGVFALGLVTLALSQFVVPEQLYPWLNLASGILVVGVGLGILRLRLREWRHARAHADAGHAHAHGHAHGHSHEHALPDTGLRGLLGVGISGGLLPCPTALVVLLAAISLHRVGYGLVLILAFSVGLAGAMSAIGLVAVSAKRAFSGKRLGGASLRLLPAVSALVVLAFGVLMTARALPTIG